MSIENLILLCAHDVGPMRYLLALDRHISCRRLWLGSSLSSELIAANCYEKCSDYTKQRPSVLVTGSGIGSTWDLDMLAWARRMQIPSVSIVDHWSCYRRRFVNNDHLVLPDHIVVNDEIAKAQAVEEGLPEERIFVGGNPWLEHLAKMTLAPSLHNSWRQQCGLPENRLIVFIGESLKASFPKGSPEYLGYDEYEVLQAVIEAAPSGSVVVIKRHPEEPDHKYDSFLDKNKVCTVRHATLMELILEADCIVGMTSMLLLELAFFRDDILSFTPNATHSFIGNVLGATTPVLTKCDLRKKLSINKRFDGSYSRSKSFHTKFKHSGRRISEFLGSLIGQ